MNSQAIASFCRFIILSSEFYTLLFLPHCNMKGQFRALLYNEPTRALFPVALELGVVLRLVRILARHLALA